MLSFTYRVIPVSSVFRLWLSCWLLSSSFLSSSSIAQAIIWDGAADGLQKEWRKVKLSLPANVLGIVIESRQAVFSIDNIYVTSASVASIPYAYVRAADSHSCALNTAHGQIRCWGSGSFGKLGQGNLENIGDDMNEMGDNLAAVDLGSGRTAKQVSAGQDHTCALLDNDMIKCWGNGFYGQLGQGNSENIGDDMNEMGDDLAAVDLGSGRTAKQVSAGEAHTCALLDNDMIKCWGNGFYGQLGQGNSENIGDDMNEMGDDLAALDLGSGRTAKQVSAGRAHTCALLDNDMIKCWGCGDYGQLGQGNSENIGDDMNEMGDDLAAVDLGSGRTAKQVSAGQDHTCALLDNDMIKCWGKGSSGQLGQGYWLYNIGDHTYEMGDTLAAVDLGSGRTAKQVSAGQDHTCALLDNDMIKCWGNGLYGQLGQGNSENIGDNMEEMGDYLAAVDLGSGRTAKQVSAGEAHTCALLDNDMIKCWGKGYYGQLGQGSTENIGDQMYEMGDYLSEVDTGTFATSVQTNIRLVDAMLTQGRVQVKVHDYWRDVCDDNWNNVNAQVVCRQLGLAGGLASFHWNGSGQFGMDNVACIGDEVDIGQCPFRGWGVHDCGFWEAAAVECHLDAWTRFADPTFSARRGHSLVWDAASASMLVFAGHEAGFFRHYNDVWRGNEQGIWEQLLVGDGPSARGGHSAVWDFRSRTMLVFGGSYLTSYSDELWLFSMDTSSWKKSDSPTKPHGRAYHSGVWDADNQMLLVFAGERGVNLADFWEYHFLSNTWKELTPSSDKPSARSRHSAVWADAIKAMLMFGGWDLMALDDLWHYGRWTNSWTLLSPANPPSGRAGHSAVWDARTLSILTFGGVKVLNESHNYTAELWNYSILTNSWTPLAPPGPYPSPTAREDHVAWWDPSSRYMYLLGGYDVSYKKDMWRYVGVEAEEVPVEECFLGQECSLQLASRRLEAGDILTVVNFFTGSSEPSLLGLYLKTLDGYNFSFALENSTSEDSDQNRSDLSDPLVMQLQPGLYRIRWCPSLEDCESHWFDVGLLIVAGPFPGQSFICDQGAPCVISGLQGSRLSKTDQLLPMKECGTLLQTSLFPEPQPISASASTQSDDPLV